MLALDCGKPGSARCECRTATELIWEGGNTATAIGKQGQSLCIGDEWRPDALFALAVESDLMQTFVSLLRDASVEVLGYVSAGELVDLEVEQHLFISVCVVVETAPLAALAEGAWQEACDVAPLARVLGSRLHAKASVTHVSGDTDGRWHAE